MPDSHQQQGDGGGGPAGNLAEVAELVSAKRKGVPQWSQPHVMLTRGLQELENLFPGLSTDLQAAGAVWLPTPLDWTWFDDRMGGELECKYTAFEVGCAWEGRAGFMRVLCATCAPSTA